MKIPKKMRMFGYNFKVIINEKDAGGSFSFAKKLITTGNKHGEKEAVFLHEIMEAVLVELNLRFYGQEDAMECTFHFNHTDFCRFHKALYAVLKDNKLI